ncbi:MAG: DinB family protein [Thermoanaerobaculia bacterium]|nr:DinB family protein [Thermoanaerobaculia bacterium]
MPLTDHLTALFRRDLAGLRREVEAYPDDGAVWQAVPGLTNSGGVLVRHLCGNLQHFVGAGLGNTGYVRDREAEFGALPWPRERLLAEIAATEKAVTETLAGLPPEAVSAPYPAPVGDLRLDTDDFLTHLAVHLGFHLGQVGYHRRVVTGEPKSVVGNTLGALASARPA